jgi:hypothetical protein
MRRKLIETLERRKEMMIAALWANSGFEGQKGADARRDAIEELESNFEDAVVTITSKEAPEEDIDTDNPFFAAAERGLAKIAPPPKTEGTVEEAVNEDEDPYAEMEIDQ